MNNEYIQIAGLHEQLASKENELAGLNYNLDSLTKDLKSKNELNLINEKRIEVLEEENNLKKQSIVFKSNYIKELECSLELNVNKEEVKVLFNELETIYSTINISILKDHIDYLALAGKECSPNTFEEIVENLKLLIELKKLYDQGQEERQYKQFNEL